MHPWWVQVALNALKVPFAGCVTTVFVSWKIFPPLTGMSLVLIPEPAAGALLAGAPVGGGAAALVAGGGSPAVGGQPPLPLSVPHAASVTATPAGPPPGRLSRLLALPVSSFGTP